MTRAGMQQVWLVFQASVSGHHQNYLAGESLEIPVPANVIGTSYLPQKNSGSHVNVHQELLNELQAQGWQLLPNKSSSWWERRLRRPALVKKSPFDWFKRKKSNVK